jgi:hypothetical protein
MGFTYWLTLPLALPERLPPFERAKALVIGALQTASADKSARNSRLEIIFILNANGKALAPVMPQTGKHRLDGVYFYIVLCLIGK